MTRQRTFTAAHWGVYEVEYDEAGKAAVSPAHAGQLERLLPYAK